MGKQFFYLCFVTVICCKLFRSSHAIESPQYTVLHSESDYEIRLYKEISWMTAPVREPSSFEKATKDGFHRLYEYIHGANQNSTELVMTSPVLTSIMSSTHESDYYVRYYLPSKFERMPPQPSPELNLQVDKWKTRCTAIRKFSGFAKDDTIDDELQALLNSLHKNTTAKRAAAENKNSYSIAQYNAPTQPSGRLNEVWYDVSGYSLKGCPQN